MPVGRSRVNLPGEQGSNDRWSTASTSGQRWLDNMSMDMIPVAGFHMGDQNVAPGVNYVRDPSLITVDAQGNQVTPRWNVAQAGVNDHFSRNAALLIAALAAGGVGAAALGGEGAAAGAAAGGAEAGSGLDLSLLPTIADGSASLPAMVSAPEIAGGAAAATPALEATGSMAGSGAYTVPEGLPAMSGPGAAEGGSAYDLIDLSGTGSMQGSGAYTVQDGLPPMSGPGAFDAYGSNGPGFFDRLLGGLDSLSSLKGLPGLLSGLAGAAPGAARGGVGGGIGGAGPAGAIPHGSIPPQALKNPYGAVKVNQPGTLMSYLRGS